MSLTVYDTLFQWKRVPPVLFLVYRLVSALYAVGTLIGNVTLYGVSLPMNPHSIMVYLSAWTYVLLTLHFIIAFATALHANIAARGTTIHNSEETPRSGNMPATAHGDDIRGQRSLHGNRKMDTHNSGQVDKIENGISDIGDASDRRQDGPQLSMSNVPSQELSVRQEKTAKLIGWPQKLSWLLFAVSVPSSFVVTVGYFAMVYPSQVRDGYKITVLDLNLHAINFLMVVFELLLNAYPVRLLHTLYIAIYVLIYTVFSVFYWMGDHKLNVLYAILDWNAPLMSSLVIAGFIFFKVYNEEYH